ncbi:reverse transcriptase domain-containing protein, partial [Tanacetum coccineum]
VLEDFLNEIPVCDNALVPRETTYTKEDQKDRQEEWMLFTDGASSLKGSGAGLVLISPTKTEYTYALRLTFDSTNNQAEYEALLVGLRIAKKMGVQALSEEGTWPEDENAARELRMKISQYVIEEGVLFKRSYLMPMLRCVGPLQANYVIREIHMGACSMHMKPRLVVAQAIRQGYYWPTMHKDAREEIRKCDSCQIHASVPRMPKTLMTSIMAPWPFFQWGMDVLGPLPEALGKVKYVIVAIDYLTKWIEAKPLAKTTRKEVKKFVWDNIVCSCTSSSKWPSRKREPKPHERHKNAPGKRKERLVIPAEVGMPTHRTMMIKDGKDNDEKIRLNLDLLTERREVATIREARYKMKVEQYYNKRVRPMTFKVGEYVY